MNYDLLILTFVRSKNMKSIKNIFKKSKSLDINREFLDRAW